MKWTEGYGPFDTLSLVDQRHHDLVNIGKYKDNCYYQISLNGKLSYLFSYEEIEKNYRSIDKCKRFVEKKLLTYFRNERLE